MPPVDTFESDDKPGYLNSAVATLSSNVSLQVTTMLVGTAQPQSTPVSSPFIMPSLDEAHGLAHTPPQSIPIEGRRGGGEGKKGIQQEEGGAVG